MLTPSVSALITSPHRGSRTDAGVTLVIPDHTDADRDNSHGRSRGSGANIHMEGGGATVKEESPPADGKNLSWDLLLQFMSTEVAAQ